MGVSTAMLMIDFFCICLGLGGIIAGGVGHSWWKSELLGFKYEGGLWRSCDNLRFTTYTCYRRSGVLKFIEDTKYLDIILILLIAATFFALLALLTVAIMCCCQNSRGAWYCGCVFAAITIFFAMLATIAGLGYAESEKKWENGLKRGWSVIAVWAGAALCLLSFILTLVLCCLPPKHRNSIYGSGYPMR